jgi:hypothetical protein
MKIDWSYYIPDRFKQGGRGGYEFFPMMVITYLQ